MLPQLLISVRDAREATVAIACGVDIIDIKEPARGALGRADEATVAEVVHGVEVKGNHRRRPVTMALGELRDLNPDDIAIPRGISAVKLGLAGCETRLKWRDKWAALKARCDDSAAAPNWVAVFYADHHLARSPLACEIIEAGAQLGCNGVLIDTYSKCAGRLWDFIAVETLSEWVDAIHENEMFAAVAGSIQSRDLPRLRDVAVDIVAVRGGVCTAGERQATIDARRAHEFRQAMTAVWLQSGSDGGMRRAGDVPAILSVGHHRLVTARDRQ